MLLASLGLTTVIGGVPLSSDGPPAERKLGRWASRGPDASAPLPDRAPRGFVRIGTGAFTGLTGPDGYADFSVGVHPMGYSGLWVGPVFRTAYGPEFVKIGGGLSVGAEFRTKRRTDRMQPYVGCFADVLGGEQRIVDVRAGQAFVASSGGLAAALRWGRWELRVLAGVGLQQSWQTFTIHDGDGDDSDVRVGVRRVGATVGLGTGWSF